MADPDMASLWETKKDADILLVMGEEKWELHDKVIRGKSVMVDFLVDQKAAVDGGVKKFALKEHFFQAPVLETVLKWFYGGDDALPCKPETFDLLASHDVAASLGVPDLTAELVSRVGRHLSDILAKRVDMLDEFMMVVEIIVHEDNETHDALKQELQKVIGPHLCMLLQQQDFRNLLEDDPNFCFDTLSTAVGEIKRVTKESEKKLDDAEKQQGANDSAIDFFDTPKSKKTTRASGTESPKTPDISKTIKLESPAGATEASGTDSMLTADAGSTPFAGPRFSRGMDTGAFNFTYRDERAFPPKFPVLSIKRVPARQSPAVKPPWAPTPFPTPSGKASPSTSGSDSFESCESGSEEGEIREKRRAIFTQPSFQKKTPPGQTDHKPKPGLYVPGSFEASLPMHTQGVGSVDVHARPAVSLPTDRRSGTYHLSSPFIQQDDSPELPTRRSGSYAFSSTSIQQDSLVPEKVNVPDKVNSDQPESKQPADARPDPRPPTMPSHHKEPLQRPAPREMPFRAPASAPAPPPTPAPAPALETGPKLDRKTAREVNRGRLHVKTTKRAKTPKMYDADAPNIDCVQS